MTYRNLADLLRNVSPDVRDENGFAAPVPAPVPAPAPAPEPASQSIVLPLPPSANVYWRNYRGRTVVSASAKAYKAGVGLVAQHHGMHPMTGPIAVYVHVYRARKVGDLDNYKKVLYDALQGIAYNDDDQIVEEHSWRWDDKANPRVEVEIRRVER